MIGNVCCASVLYLKIYLASYVTMQTVSNLSELEEKDCIPSLPLQNGAVVKVLRVLDGDTICIGFYRDGIAQKISLRLLGYDAAEVHTKDLMEKKYGLYAKEKLEDICSEKLIMLKTVALDKYGRVLADASVGDIPSISDYMLQFKDCCKPYHGERKTSWHFDGPPPHRKTSMIPPPVRKLSHQLFDAIKNMTNIRL